jgi:hypothetical protein
MNSTKKDYKVNLMNTIDFSKTLGSIRDMISYCKYNPHHNHSNKEYSINHLYQKLTLEHISKVLKVSGIKLFSMMNLHLSLERGTYHHNHSSNIPS